MPMPSIPVNHKLQQKSGRKPLQPKNSFPTTTKAKHEWFEISLIGEFNKENHPIYAAPTKIESFDASLAEELSAIRKKLQRLRLDRDKTEKMLRERDNLIDMQMKELQCRGEIQKSLEMEVDRLYRLKQLKSYCMRISPIRSLRDKELGKKNRINDAQSQSKSQSQELKDEDIEESVGENTSQSGSWSPSEEIGTRE